MASDKQHRVLVVAPVGRDAQLLCEALGKHGTVCESFVDIPQLCGELRYGAGAILLVEEALGPGALEHLSGALSTQPKWSDLPVIVLTSNCPRMEAAARQMFWQERIRGNLVILERPVRPLSLSSTVEAALTTRARQYEMRDYLDQRTRAEELLRKANDRLEMILNSITDRFFALDKEWRVTDFNKQAEEQLRMLGKEPVDFRGAVLWEQFPDSPTEDILRRAMAERMVITHEHYYPPLGEWVENRIYPSPDGGLAIFQRYVTERKRAEEAVRESEERYRLLIEGVRDYAIVMLDTDGRVISWNQGAERISGYTSDEIIGEHFSRFYSAEDVQQGKPESHLRRAAEEGRCEVEGWRIRRDGIRFWANAVITPLSDMAGRVRGFAKIVRDITERKRVEEKLRRSETYLAEGQRISHTGSWAVKVPSGEVFWSAEMFRICGLDPETTVISQQIAFQLIHPEDRAFVEEAIAGAIREKTDYDVEHRAILPDGSLRYVHALGHPVSNEAGDIVEYVGTVADITERNRAEEALEKLQAQLAHVGRVTMIGELGAAIAHELNQPLGAIVNNANVALRLAAAATTMAPAELLEVLADIVKDVSRASAIVARIRALVKQLPPATEPLQLDDLVQDVLALAERAIAEQRIAVRIEIPNDLPPASGDRVQLEQVLLNLIMNGIEAMSGVETSRRILTIRAHPAALNGRPAVQITVHDLGCGFSAEQAGRLFESFYTTKPNGLGMGLSICRSIVEAHGGRLWAQANENSGATFLFSLPVESQ